jgi:hypothetical protein
MRALLLNYTLKPNLLATARALAASPIPAPPS